MCWLVHIAKTNFHQQIAVVVFVCLKTTSSGQEGGGGKGERRDLHINDILPTGLTVAVACMQKYTTAQQLAKEVHAFNREQGLPRDLIPAASILRAADRLDLLSEIQRHGGAVSLAAHVGMRTQRGSGYACTAAAAQALSEFAESCNARSNVAREEWCMPTQQQLKQAGHYDLLTAITKFGQANLAQAAGLKPNSRGRPGRVVTRGEVPG